MASDDLPDVELHVGDWVLRIDHPDGKSGYYAYDGTEGGAAFVEPGNGLALRFSSREGAQRCAQALSERHHLDIERFTPEQIVHDREVELRFGGGKCPDGFKVDWYEQRGKRYLVLWESGEEKAIALEDDEADLLVRLLAKLKHYLPGGKDAKHDNRQD